MLPSKSDITVCCAHPAYQIHDELAARNRGVRSFQVRERDELPDHLSEADVLVISGFWGNELLERAPKLRFIQSIGAGTDQFDRDLLRGNRRRSAGVVARHEPRVSGWTRKSPRGRRLPGANPSHSSRPPMIVCSCNVLSMTRRTLTGSSRAGEPYLEPQTL
jgi:hypothetical protein